MMNLHDYLKGNGITQSEFANLLNIKQPTVSRLLRGECSPSLDLAVRIERVTKGSVPASSWVPEAGTSNVTVKVSASRK